MKSVANRKAILAVSALLLASSASAIDINSSTALQYYGNGDLDFEVERNGRVQIPNGNLDVGGNEINDIGGLQSCGPNEFVNGNGNCETDTDTDTTLTEDETEQFIFDTGDNDQGNLGLNGNEIVDTQGSVTLGGGNVDVPDGSLAVSGTTDGVDLDNPGNAITVNSNQYAVASGSIADNEIANNVVDNSEIQNSDNFVFNNVRMNGRIQEIGNKDTNNIYDNGDLVLESDDKIEFSDSGTTYMEIGASASEGNTQINSQGDVTTQGRLDVNNNGGEISDASGSSIDVKDDGNVVVTLG